MKWWRKWNYDFNDEPPLACLDYASIAKYYGGEEYKRRLIHVVRESLKSSLGEEGATNLLENLQDGIIKPVNTTSFFRTRTLTNDVGTEANRSVNRIPDPNVRIRRYLHRVCDFIQRAAGSRYRQHEGYRSWYQGLQPHQRQAHRQLR